MNPNSRRRMVSANQKTLDFFSDALKPSAGGKQNSRSSSCDGGGSITFISDSQSRHEKSGKSNVFCSHGLKIGMPSKNSQQPDEIKSDEFIFDPPKRWECLVSDTIYPLKSMVSN